VRVGLGYFSEFWVAEKECHGKQTQKQTAQPQRIRCSHVFSNRAKGDCAEGHDAKGHHDHADDTSSHLRRGVKLEQGHIKGHKDPAHESYEEHEREGCSI
jgi:hypothetical protein